MFGLVLARARSRSGPLSGGPTVCCIAVYIVKGRADIGVSLLAPWAADSSGITRSGISGTTGTGAAAEAAALETAGWDYRVGTTNNRRGFGGSSTPSSAESPADRRRWRRRFATGREQEHGTARHLASMRSRSPRPRAAARLCGSEAMQLAQRSQRHPGSTVSLTQALPPLRKDTMYLLALHSFSRE